MKTLILAIALFLFVASPSRADPKEFSEVSRGHWSLSALQKLQSRGIIEIPQAREHPRGLFTRYEIAVAIARLIEKVGYDPKFAPDSRIDQIDARWVKDILVALLFEYRDEVMRLGVTDPMTSGYWEIEAYQRAKEKHRALNASEWYIYAKDQPWKKEIVVPPPRGGRFPIVPPPPHLVVIPPSMLTGISRTTQTTPTK